MASSSFFKTCVLALAMGFGAASAQAGTIFADSFETPIHDNEWQVYSDTFGDWTSEIGAGIEIQRSGVVVEAQDGIQYVELDSDFSRGGDATAGTTNSAMTRRLNLTAGTYLLEWYYQPRTGTEGDNGIAVYLAVASQELLNTLIATSDGVGANGWIYQSAQFSVDGSDNPYAITFIATGEENTLGGFIDSVKLSSVLDPAGRPLPVPVPAGMPLLLGSIIAFGALGRNRKR